MDDIRPLLRGKVAREGDRLILVIDDLKPSPRKFLLNEATGKDDKETASFKNAFETAEQMVGKEVEVEGFWRAAPAKTSYDVLLVRTCRSV